VRLLLDTHVFLWLRSDPGRLRDETLTILKDPENAVLLSVVSVWELAIKQSLQKLTLPDLLERWLPRVLEESGLDVLGVTLDDAMRVRALPWHHRDPFDRLLVAQAQAGLVLVTADVAIRAYGVPTLAA